MTPTAARAPVARNASRRLIARNTPRRLRQELAASAYVRLRNLIVSGRLAPGAPLVEAELSQRLGISRTPVRAALQRLQQEGFVAASRAGTMLRAMVAPLTSDDVREVFLMVGALEAVAARLAATLPGKQRQDLANGMARVADGLRDTAGATPPDVSKARELHARFHAACSAAAAGPRLLAELEVLQPQAERYERAYTSAALDAVAEAAREHAAIVHAVRDGDPDAAERAVITNWRSSAERYRHALTVLGERGNW